MSSQSAVSTPDPQQIASDADVDADDLLSRSESAAARGWDSNLDEWQPGLSVIAAPIQINISVPAYHRAKP